MKKLISFAITATITLATATTAFAQTFTDVPTNHWAYTAIEKAVDNGAVKGVGNNKYNPNQEVTNAEWNKMIVNIFWTGIEREPYPNKVWWSSDMDWSMTSLILNDTDLYNKLEGQSQSSANYTNAVYEPINRYEMAQIVYNVANHPDKDINLDIKNVNTSGISSKISDYNSIPSQYRDAVEFCYASGLITGVDANGTFAGTQPMTRASSAVILSRLIDAKAGKWVVPTTPVASNTTTTPATTVTPVANNTNTTPAVANPTAVADMIKLSDPQLNKNKGKNLKVVTVTNKYIPGKLANGKDITPENIDAMFTEIKIMFPDEMSWGDSKNGGAQYSYGASNPSPVGGGCNAYAGMVCDTIFGRGAKWTKVVDMNQMKKGDLVIKKDAQGTLQHVFVVTDVYTIDGITCYRYTDGNSNAKVCWLGTGDVNSLLINSPKAELYTAY